MTINYSTLIELNKMSGVLYKLVCVYALSCFKKLVLWSSPVHWWCCASRNVFSLVHKEERLGLIHPVFVLPDFEPLDKVLSALESGVQAILLPFETGHILHGDKYHLFLAVWMFRLDLQLLYIFVPDLRAFSRASALIRLCVE